MSALGHNQILKCQHPMSALPQKADIAERDRHVRFVPEADIEATPIIAPKGILFRVVR
jgi:hypothetical protein